MFMAANTIEIINLLLQCAAVFMADNTITFVTAASLCFESPIVFAATKYAWRTSMINDLGSCIKRCMSYRETIKWTGEL